MKKELVKIEDIRGIITAICKVFTDMGTVEEESLPELQAKYATLRKELNSKLISFAIGGEIKTDTDGQLDGWLARKGPSAEDISTVNGLLNAILIIEAADDPAVSQPNIDDVDAKVLSMKDFEKRIDESGIRQAIINTADVSTLASLANKVRKNRTRWTWILVGIGAVVLIGAGTAVYLCTRKDDDIDELDAGEPTGELEAPDLDSLEVPDLDNLEVPELV